MNTSSAVVWREVDEQTFWREIGHTWRQDVVDAITHYYLPVPAEPWQPGDVVRDAVGRVWKRANPHGWLEPGRRAVSEDEIPTRPLTRLVPEPEKGTDR